MDKESLITEFARKIVEVLKGNENESEDESKEEDEEIWQTLSDDTEQRCIPCTLYGHKAPTNLKGHNRGGDRGF